MRRARLRKLAFAISYQCDFVMFGVRARATPTSKFCDVPIAQENQQPAEQPLYTVEKS